MALSRPRFRFICIALLGLPFILFYAEAAVVIPWTLPSQIDFHPSWAAAVQVSHGLSPYPAAVIQGRWQDVQGVAYVYPPLSAWLLQPLARVPYATASRAWLIIQQGCVLLLIVVLGRLLHLQRAEHWLLLAIGVLSSTLLQGEIQIGQLNLLITVLVALWLAAWLQSPRRGVLPLALAIGSKLYPAPLLLPAMLARRWKLVGGVVAVTVLLPLLTPSASLEYFVRVLPHVTGATDQSRNTALSASVARAFHPPTVVLTVAWAIVLVTALLLAVIAIRGLAEDRPSRMLQVLVMVCATPFLSPLMELGHLVPLILPVFLVAPMAWRGRQYWALTMIVGGWAVISYHQLLHGSWGSWAPGESLWEASGGLGAVAVYAGILVIAKRTTSLAGAMVRATGAAMSSVG